MWRRRFGRWRAAGLVTADGLEALRQRLRGTVKRPRRTSYGDRFRMNGRNGLRSAPGRGGLPSAYGYGGGSRPAFAAPPESANPMGGRGARGVQPLVGVGGGRGG